MLGFVGVFRGLSRFVGVCRGLSRFDEVCRGLTSLGATLCLVCVRMCVCGCVCRGLSRFVGVCRAWGLHDACICNCKLYILPSKYCFLSLKIFKNI